MPPPSLRLEPALKSATCAASTRQAAPKFNQKLTFDTSSVTNMYYMFLSASAFNQPLSFDTSSVTNMGYMFYNAGAFNQPLTLDTSGVTSMRYMFGVRSARALWPPAFGCPTLKRATCAAATARPPVSRPAPCSASHALFSTRQDARAFNQPLTFDTSSVTAMPHMFLVRSARAMPVQSATPCTPPLASPSPAASRLLARPAP